MSIEERRNSRVCLLSVLLGLLVACPCAFGEVWVNKPAEEGVADPFPFGTEKNVTNPQYKPGLITWLHPDGDKGMFTLEPSHSGIQVTVTRAKDGRKIESADDFRAVGWMFTQDGFLRSTPDRSGEAGEKIYITLANLFPGKQNVYVRYHARPQVPGNTWFFKARAGLIGELHALDPQYGQIVRGLGGYDPNTVYEAKLGTVGNDDKAADMVTFWLKRYVWSEFVKFGSIRIDTETSMDAPLTAIQSPENEQMRNVLLQNGPKDKDGKTAYGANVVSGALKVRPKKFDSLKNQPIDDKIVIHAARHEYENRQIVIYSPNQQLRDVQLQASQLRSAHGKSADGMKVLFCPVGYLRSLATPQDLDQYGYWPDPIMSYLDTLDVNQHDVQSLWYRVYVPYQTEPGKYTGTVTIKPANAPEYRIPVEVNVWDIDLPKMPHFRMVVNTFDPKADLEEQWATELEYKMNPGEIYSFMDGTTDQFSNWAEKGITAWCVAYYHHTDTDPKTKMPNKNKLDEFCDKIEVRLKASEAAGLRDKAYVYYFDEAAQAYWPAMKVVSEAIAKRFPDLLQLTTANIPIYSDKDEYEHINPCPILFHFNYEQAQKAKENGKEVWWYVCMNPPTPAPNLLFRNTAMASRQLMGFHAAANNIDGFLYWSTRFGWAGQAGISSIYDKGWLIDITGSIDGDGQLYQKDTQGRHLPSIRMENIRDGMEDYDLLYIAREKVKQLEDAGISFLQLKRMKKELYLLCKPTNELASKFFQSTQELEETRKMLGEFIQLAAGKLNAEGK